MKKLLNHEKKFKKLSTDPTHLREGQLQRYLRKLNRSKNFLDKKTYDELYPSRSQYARMYGLSKLRKVKDSCPLPPFRSIVSSIGTMIRLHLQRKCKRKDILLYLWFLLTLKVYLQTYLWWRQLIWQLMRYLKAILI